MPIVPMNALVVAYERLLIIFVALVPLLAVVYIQHHQDPGRVFANHSFHVVAISLAILLGAFVSYVTWRCYLESGEVFLRWLTLGFVGFVVVYAPHGFLTPFASSNPWLFLLYGPASRAVMAVCFLAAMVSYDRRADASDQRGKWRHWAGPVGVFVVVDILVAWWALSEWRTTASPRLGLEYFAVTMYVVTVIWMLVQRIHNRLMAIFAIALLWFAQSSFAFTYGLLWNHQWWLAHIIFAGGFLLLSYGVVQAYFLTGSFSNVYSQSELLEQLRNEKYRTEQAMTDLQRANEELERVAATDPLTGIANRRAFLQRAELELSRSQRSESPFSLILIDLDHFKQVNDKYSHETGDAVLQAFTERMRGIFRPVDLFARIGGEEFAALLPDTQLQGAIVVAERIRKGVQVQPLVADDEQIPLTVSLGVVTAASGQERVRDMMRRADALLYKAKERGRNRVEAA